MANRRVADVPLTALRWEPFVRKIRFRNLDLSGAIFTMQIRAYRDAPSAFLTLQNSAGSAQGLSVDVETVDGVVISTVYVRINERTLEDLLPFPDSGVKAGQSVALCWDMHITKAPALKRRWVQGSFIIEPGATQNIIPSNTFTSGLTLGSFQNAIAALQASSPSGKVTVAILGDSYAEQTKIWDAFRQLYADDGLNIVGDGWINVRGITEPTGVTVTRSGFTLWDASDNTAATYKAGIDGHYIVRSGTGGSFKVEGTIATRLKLFYDRGQTGKFQWRVDGGAWTTVTPTGSAGTTFVDIGPLPLAAHTLEVDTSVSTGGNVVLQGVYSTRDGPGIEFLKAGNSSLQASDLVKYADPAGDCMSLLAPKLIIIILGTNDYQRSDSPPSTFASEVAAFVATMRSLNSGASYLFILPPDTNGTAVNPLSAYDTAMDTTVAAIGIEKFSWLRLWDTWAVENDAGNFTDFEHPNAKGALDGIGKLKTYLLDAR